MSSMAAMKIGIVGCGAIVELGHAPALAALAADGRATVAALVDPSAERRAKIGRFFPAARAVARLEELAAGDIELAVVASPARFHAEQTIALLERGVHVLCEKPLAATVAEGEAMVAAARRTGRVLAAGQFRRFFPALQALRQYVTTAAFGALRTFAVEEGGPFNWPAATPSFFDPQQAGGGVLLDLGVHVLDTLAWWLGEPAALDYADDAEGGLEANCRLRLGYASGAKGTVRLSRDGRTANRWQLKFERASVIWRAGEANRLELRISGTEPTLAARVTGDEYAQAFTRQLLDAIDAAAQGRAPRVPGEEALRSLRTIARCYREKTPLAADAP